MASGITITNTLKSKPKNAEKMVKNLLERLSGLLEGYPA
jgi:hypothetical protein